MNYDHVIWAKYIALFFFVCGSFVFVCSLEIFVSYDLALNFGQDRYLHVNEEFSHFSTVVCN